MQLTQRMTKKVNIFSPSVQSSGYVGKKTVPIPVGFVYAEVFPEKSSQSEERSGRRTRLGATLIMRRDAGVKCGDLAGVFGEQPDSRICEVSVFPGHISVRTEEI